MSVVRLPGERLLVHSPVPIDPSLKEQIDRLGTVSAVVAPNAYHHFFAGPATKLWPNARLFAAAKLRKKRPDLPIDADLEHGLPHDLVGDDIETLPILGSMLHETVLFHRPTGTLLSADLLENFPEMDHALTRTYLKLGGVLGKPGWHPLLRVVYTNRAKARRSIEALLDLPIERVGITHGAPIVKRPKEALREGLAFLLR